MSLTIIPSTLISFHLLPSKPILFLPIQSSDIVPTKITTTHNDLWTSCTTEHSPHQPQPSANTATTTPRDTLYDIVLRHVEKLFPLNCIVDVQPDNSEQPAAKRFKLTHSEMQPYGDWRSFREMFIDNLHLIITATVYKEGRAVSRQIHPQLSPRINFLGVTKSGQ